MYCITITCMDDNNNNVTKIIRTNDDIELIISKCKQFSAEYLISQFTNVTDKSFITINVYDAIGRQLYNRIVFMPKGFVCKSHSHNLINYTHNMNKIKKWEYRAWLMVLIPLNITAILFFFYMIYLFIFK